jgi:hypothetical protein
MPFRKNILVCLKSRFRDVLKYRGNGFSVRFLPLSSRDFTAAEQLLDGRRAVTVAC